MANSQGKFDLATQLIHLLAPGTRADGYHQYTVEKPFIVESAKVAPAMGQAGGGTQYRIVTPAGEKVRVNVDYLIKNGYLK